MITNRYKINIYTPEGVKTRWQGYAKTLPEALLSATKDCTEQERDLISYKVISEEEVNLMELLFEFSLISLFKIFIIILLSTGFPWWFNLLAIFCVIIFKDLRKNVFGFIFKGFI